MRREIATGLITLIFAGVSRAGEVARQAPEEGKAARRLAAGNAALARSDFSAANSEWTFCLLEATDADARVSKECEERLSENKDRRTALPPPANEMIPLLRVAHAPVSLKGLSGEALRDARTKNMYEAFLDCKEFERGVIAMRAQKDPSKVASLLKRSEATLQRRQRDLRESERFFAKPDRVADVHEFFSAGIRTVEVTFVNGKTLKVSEAVRELDFSQKRRSIEPMPDVKKVHGAVQDALDAADAIDQPVGETEEQQLKRLGLSPK